MADVKELTTVLKIKVYKGGDWVLASPHCRRSVQSETRWPGNSSIEYEHSYKVYGAVQLHTHET